MTNWFSKKTIFRPQGVYLMASLLIALAGCGDGGGTGAGGTTTTGGTTTVASPTLTIALTDANGVTTTSVSSGGLTYATATVLDAAGAPVPSAVVTFTTDTALITLTPTSGTALTNASGVATVSMSPASTSAGATTVTATSQVSTYAVTGSIGVAVGGAAVGGGGGGVVTPLVISAPTFGVGAAALSAFGTTSVTVTVTQGGVPVASTMPVSFSSTCAASGKATISTPINTVAGVAVASYADNGCGATDTITATVSGSVASSATLVVSPPATGSIQFVSATPTSIGIKGTGGVETAQVFFKVLDAGGNPLGGKTVTFSLDTTVGGITLNPSPPTAISGADGLVYALVGSGTISTPVRVTASTPGVGGVTLTTQSNLLTITTGIPDQDSFSISKTATNIEGWEYDGITSVITVRMSDHFNNPVPDGTPVNFTTSGGSIIASCSTTAGACSSTITSQQPKPAGGKVRVLAYAVGEESFTDLNGNGLADAGELGLDMGEAYRDDNGNGIRDASTEPYIDFDSDSTYDGADGLFNGVLCTTPGTGICSATKTLHVRGSALIIFSGSAAYVTAKNATGTTTYNSTTPIALTGCSAGIHEVVLTIQDVNNNPMPKGTTIAVTTTNGTMSGSANYVVGDATSPTVFPIFIKDDGSVDPATLTCTDNTPSGNLKVEVITPLANKTTYYYPVNN